jgi:hypothetical protein
MVVWWRVEVLPADSQVAAETVPSTIEIGMITKMRKNEVSRLSGRSGYSTAN